MLSGNTEKLPDVPGKFTENKPFFTGKSSLFWAYYQEILFLELITWQKRKKPLNDPQLKDIPAQLNDKVGPPSPQ